MSLEVALEQDAIPEEYELLDEDLAEDLAWGTVSPEAGAYLPPDGFEAALPFRSTTLSNEILQEALPAAAVQQLRENIVRLTEQQWRRWGQGTVHETSDQGVQILRHYYRTGVGERRGDRLSSPVWHSQHPWSAVFISWIMKNAGAREFFRYSRGHHYYIAAAKRNRMNRTVGNPFWTYRVSEIAPKPGDLVCNERAGSGVTYDNVHDVSVFRSSHSDIVTAVQPNRLIVVGGNTGQRFPRRGLAGNTVGKKAIRTDDRGFIVQRGRDPYFAVIAVQGIDAGGRPSAIGRGSSGIAQKIQAALQSARWTTALGLAILSGQRDVGKLTNLIFFARHPERSGRPIRRHERTLAREWLHIRNRLVIPFLRRFA